MPDNTIFTVRPEANTGSSVVTMQKWGGLAAFLLAVAFIVPELIYLTGNLRDVSGPVAYGLADFLYGPLKAVCLVTLVYALRERIGERAPGRMSLVLLTALLAAGMFVTAALLRSTNRHYHLIQPELHLEMSQTVLIVWTTLVGGVIATAWHFLGWSLLLLGLVGWTTGHIPRLLSVLYWVAGALSLFVYLLPEHEGGVILLCLAVSIWQGILLWKSGRFYTRRVAPQ